MNNNIFKTKKISNWGNYPIVKDALVSTPNFIQEVVSIVKNHQEIIARGNGRSYGDASLNKVILSMLKINKIIEFNKKEGHIICESGILLSDILEFIVPKGFFLEVTPGTKFITLGGAIAADVHGKNHHKVGNFSNSMLFFDIVVDSGKILRCSREKNEKLFRNTVGGMGLTGIIVLACIKLKKIETAYIQQETIKTKNLEETINLFNQSNHWTYTVAWFDSLKKGSSEGRSLFFRGEHANLHDLPAFSQRKPLTRKTQKRIKIPFYAPSFLLNKFSVYIFNVFYYNKQFKKKQRNIVHYDHFFYPLDGVLNWNKLYGKKGFTQYQFVIPHRHGIKGIKEILDAFRKHHQYSLLTVFKEFGDNGKDLPKSFPMKGYTVSLDIRINNKTNKLINDLDKIVLKYDGKNYLAKDAFSSINLFNIAYNKQKITKFISNQYRRLKKHDK